MARSVFVTVNWLNACTVHILDAQLTTIVCLNAKNVWKGNNIYPVLCILLWLMDFMNFGRDGH